MKGRLFETFYKFGTKESNDYETFSDRFLYKDFVDGSLSTQTLKFSGMNGWVLMKEIAKVTLYYRPYCIVEIGAGVSTIVLAHLAEEAGVKLYSCDKSPRKHKVYGQNHEFHQVLSEDFMRDFTDTPAVVLIDANHDYEIAKREFWFFFQRLVEGGIIFIHDTYPAHKETLSQDACGDVYKLRQDLEQRTDQMDCLTFPYTAGWAGLTMVIKKEKDRPYWGK